MTKKICFVAIVQLKHIEPTVCFYYFNGLQLKFLIFAPILPVFREIKEISSVPEFFLHHSFHPSIPIYTGFYFPRHIGNGSFFAAFLLKINTVVVFSQTEMINNASSIAEMFKEWMEINKYYMSICRCCKSFLNLWPNSVMGAYVLWLATKQRRYIRKHLTVHGVSLLLYKVYFHCCLMEKVMSFWLKTNATKVYSIVNKLPRQCSNVFKGLALKIRLSSTKTGQIKYWFVTRHHGNL